MFDFFRNKYVWAVLSVTLVSLLVIRYTSMERPTVPTTESLIRGIYIPMQHSVSSFRHSVENMGRHFADKDRLWQRNQYLERRLERVLVENQELQEYRYESLRLRRMLAFQNRNTDLMDLMGAEVVARNPSLLYKTITLDKGANHGVSAGMVVITPEGLVGRVVTVTATSSQVLLIIDSGGAVGALLQKTRVPGIIEGTGSTASLNMTQLPFYSKVKKGDRVVTSRFSEFYPPGILIGSVLRTNSERSGILKTAVVKPAVDFDKLEEVFLVRSFKAPLTKPEQGAAEVPAAL